ncbi:MAG: hypothetical protein ABW198_07220 [Pseudorhodoplanes sp.]
MEASLTKPTQEEFEVSGDVIRHAPTGYCMRFHPGSPDTGIAEVGRLGRPLADGRSYEPEEIRVMVRELRKSYLSRRVFFPED